MHFLILGGISNPLSSFKRRFGRKYATDSASIDLLSWEEGEFSSFLRYSTDPGLRTEEKGRDNRFTSGSIAGDALWVGTPTEVLKLSLGTFAKDQAFSCRHFNDIHHVVPGAGGVIYTVNTGLDMVLRHTMDGSVVEALSASEDDPWARFDTLTDYRLIGSTKPHLYHPNYLSVTESGLWLTRFETKDAVNLRDKSQKIDISVGAPHDGLLHNGELIYTTINGFLVFANPYSTKVTKVIDLNEIEGTGRPLGWCRGIAVVDEFAFVGYTRLRRTKAEENLRWLGSHIKKLDVTPPARIVQYDIARKTKVREILIPEGYTDVIFSILPYEI